MPDGRDDCGSQCSRFEIPACRGPADTAAAPRRSMFGNGVRFRLGTSREQDQQTRRHSRNQFAILRSTDLGGARSGGRTLPGIFRGLLFSFFQRRRLDEDALPFVPLARPPESNHNRRASAVLGGPPCQRGVAGRKELQVAQPRTRQAQWLTGFHREEAVLGEFDAAFGALRVPEDLEHDRLRGL
jgi:hypothetical protein